MEVLVAAYESAQHDGTLVNGVLTMEKSLSSGLLTGHLTSLEYEGIKVVLKLEMDTRSICEWTLGTPSEYEGNIVPPGSFHRMSIMWNDILNGDGSDQDWHLDFQLSTDQPILPGEAQNMACICAVSKDAVGIMLQPSGHSSMRQLALGLNGWQPRPGIFASCTPCEAWDIQVQLGYCLIFDGRLPHKGLKGVKGVFAPRIHRYVTARTTTLESMLSEDGGLATFPMAHLSRHMDTGKLGPIFKRFDSACLSAKS